MAKTNADYTAKYAEKRQAKSIKFDLYLDDAFEKELYEKIKAEPRGNAKKVFLELFKNHYGVEENDD